MASLTLSIVTPRLVDNIDTSLACLVPLRGAAIMHEACFVIVLSPYSRSHNASATTETRPKLGPYKHYRSVPSRSPVKFMKMKWALTRSYNVGGLG
jgi:hypothetical protein